jgi:DNA-binding winged helix-turn-helix (wHTH) protein/tetratricopeptide (TPR) repeat protein
MDVLVFMARSPGRVLPREEVIEAVWERQFVADATLSHAIAELRRALGDDAQRPRFIETIPKRGYRLIASVEDAEAESSSVPATSVGASGSPPRASSLNPTRLLVSAFENRTGDETLASLGPMAADRVSQGLSALGLVEVIPSSSVFVAASLRDAPAARSAGTAQSEARAAGAGTIVSGAYYAHGETIEFQLRVSDVATGRLLVAPDPVAGSKDAPATIIETLRDQAMSAVAVQFDPTLERAGFSPRRDTVRRGHPPCFEAYREYVAGTEVFGSDYPEAVRRLQRASDLDPDFAAPLLLIEGALLAQGDFAGAHAVLERLEKHRDRLTPLEIEVLAAKQADLVGRTGEALRCFSRALALSPTDLILRSQVATHELSLGWPARMLETYRTVDLQAVENTPGVLWYFAFLSAAQHVLGRFEDELDTARRTCVLHTARLPFLQATVRSLAALGRFAELSQVLESSRSLPAEGLTASRVAATASGELRAHGETERGIRVAEEALEWLRCRRGERNGENDLADEALLLLDAARWQDAQEVLAGLVDRSPTSVEYRALLGTAAARAGDRAVARHCDDHLASLHGPWLRGRVTHARARIAASLGESALALALLREAFSEGYPYGVSLHTDVSLEPLRDLPAFQELLRPKTGREEGAPDGNV